MPSRPPKKWATAASVKADLQEAGLRPSRDRGQSFLKDELVAGRQVLAAEVAPGDRVLEVGGGLGVLTRELSKQGARVLVVEIEPSLVKKLKEERLDGVQVVLGDALTADLGKPDKVVANIPYSISSPLLERLAGLTASVMVLMVQAEVAERLAAGPGSKGWSRLAAVVRRTYDVEILERVPPTAFFPQPKVPSAVVRLTRRAGKGEGNDKDYAEVVGALFAERRKKVRNTAPAAAAAIRAPPEGAVDAVENLGIADRRPEELSVQEFEALTLALAALKKP
jgi:16S rRNA (adenine1518-N6/adenine1519-N6)-dimethyltransferase